jgi:hypothetical protein
VFATDIKTGESFRLTKRSADDIKPAGAAVWSNNGKMIAFNRRVKDGDSSFFQIFLLKLL